MQAKRKRFRLQYKFWLDVSIDDELLLAEEIDDLKRNRRFVSTIRDGIRLICDLRRGNTAVLEQLFPGVISHITGESYANAEFAAMLELQRTQAAILDKLSRAEPVSSMEEISTGVEIRSQDELPSIFAPVEEMADPTEARQNFSAGLGNLFDDDDEEWD